MKFSDVRYHRARARFELQPSRVEHGIDKKASVTKQVLGLEVAHNLPPENQFGPRFHTFCSSNYR